MRDTIDMALKAGILEPIELLDSNQWRQDTIRELKAFEALVRADEREQSEDRVLADVIEMLSKQHTWLTQVAAINLVAGLYGRADKANAIRARGETK
jgi:L-fucose mutarotase/ribose pyranase (RbsD/FucU family)